MRKPKSPIILLSILTVLSVAALAHAGSKLAAKYKGQLLVSDEPFKISDDADQAKANAKNEITASANGEEGASWDFSLLGVLKAKAGSTKAVLAFIDSKTGKQATYKELTCDANQEIIVFDVSISENDGLTKGKTYDLVFSVQKGGKTVVLAKGKATFK